MFRAARLDRTLYSELVFDSYATGNAVLLVAGIYGAVYVALVLGSSRGFTVILFLNVVLGGVVQWIVAAGALWLAGTKIFPGDARFPTVLRLSGYAFTTLILLVVQPLVSGALAQLVFAAALLWFGVALAVVAEVSMDLQRRQSIPTALIAVAVWFIFAGLVGF
ncbi:MAG: YIP1 family protein [Acidimicrobiia bacterium]